MWKGKILKFVYVSQLMDKRGKVKFINFLKLRGKMY